MTGKSWVTTGDIHARADALVPIVTSLGINDTAPLWAAMRSRWTARTLDDAIRAFQTDNANVAPFAQLLVPRQPQGHWSEWSNVEAGMRALISEVGRFPQYKEFKRTGRGSLYTALQNFGGIDAVRARLGYEPAKDAKYWEHWPHAEAALTEIIKERGEFPSHVVLSKIGYFLLGTAIMEHHGGFPAVRERMGCTLTRVRDGTWNDWETSKAAILGLMKKLGHFPNTKELGENGLSGVAKVVISDFGGYAAVRARLGYPLDAVPDGHWKNEDNVIAKIREIEAKLGRFPSSVDIDDEAPALSEAIRRHHGGFRAMRSKLGIAMPQVAPGTWADFQNVETALREIEARLGRFPSCSELSENGYPSLESAICRDHGGYVAVRKRLGVPEIVTPPGSWDDFSKIEAVMREIEAEIGHLPSDKELLARGCSDVQHAIYRHHGGIRAVREKLGGAQPRLPNGWWNDFDHVADALRELERELGRFPSSEDVRKGRFKTCLNPISKLHGGYVAVRERLGAGAIRDDLLAAHADELARIVPALDVTPDVVWARMKRKWTAGDLRAAIARHSEDGALDRFRELLDG